MGGGEKRSEECAKMCKGEELVRRECDGEWE
jgi:hypothetical protein